MEDGLTVVELAIPGQFGAIEGRLLYRHEEGTKTGVILCPPHPLLAGNLDNNVVRAVAVRLAQSLPVLLFNYPAVGKSASPRPDLPLFEVWNELDQTNDYAMIVDEVQRVIDWSAKYLERFHLIGYSFGALMALNAITHRALSYTAIAPPLAACDFSALTTFSCPVCLLMAQDDTLLDAPSVLPHGPHITHTLIAGADHFFLKKENEVARQIEAFLFGGAMRED